TRGGTTRETGPRGRLDGPGRPGDPIAGMMPGERFVVEPNGGSGSSRSRGSKGWSGASGPARATDRSRPPDPDLPFVAGEIADRGPLERGPLERGAPPPPERPAREARERERQAAWRDQASRALTALKADEGTAPINALELAEPVLLSDPPPSGLGSGAARLPARSELPELDDDDEEEEEDDGEGLDETSASGSAAGREVLQVTEGLLPTLRVLPFGVSRKRLEQAIRELQLPVTIARSIDEADVVMTLRNEYRSKPPTVREAEERGMPVYVLKSNTVMQMNASLTSIFSLALDPREAALRETEEAIGMVIQRSEAVELSPQSAYIRRLQHQMAERANLVSRSRGREPYRRVRLYPDQARVWR
ncbi:MAG: R3H domain-containing nucleic acid-binding protein, partial [Candidatus Limnocylindrales bacterium]